MGASQQVLVRVHFLQRTRCITGFDLLARAKFQFYFILFLTTCFLALQVHVERDRAGLPVTIVNCDGLGTAVPHDLQKMLRIEVSPPLTYSTVLLSLCTLTLALSLNRKVYMIKVERFVRDADYQSISTHSKRDRDALPEEHTGSPVSREMNCPYDQRWSL